MAVTPTEGTPQDAVYYFTPETPSRINAAPDFFSFAKIPFLVRYNHDMQFSGRLIERCFFLDFATGRTSRFDDGRQVLGLGVGILLRDWNGRVDLERHRGFRKARSILHDWREQDKMNPIPHPSGPTELKAMKAELVPNNGDPPIPITRDVTVIGRRDGCDIVIDHTAAVETTLRLGAYRRSLDYSRSGDDQRHEGQRPARAMGGTLPRDKLSLAGYKMRRLSRRRRRAVSLGTKGRRSTQRKRQFRRSVPDADTRVLGARDWSVGRRTGRGRLL